MRWYHGTTRENWNAIQKEGVLFGRRFIVDNDGNPIKEVSRCTYLTNILKEARCYGNVVLEVDYNPLDNKGKVRKNKRGRPLNNYIPDGWQMRVYEPITIDNVKLIETKENDE